MPARLSFRLSSLHRAVSDAASVSRTESADLHAAAATQLQACVRSLSGTAASCHPSDAPSASAPVAAAATARRNGVLQGTRRSLKHAAGQDKIAELAAQPPAAVETSPISKLLIANRGEIACRVIQTARRLGALLACCCLPGKVAVNTLQQRESTTNAFCITCTY